MIIRPRLNDFYNLPFTQEKADFAIPFLDEDIPLYLDPFLLWKSPSQQDNSLHTTIISSFNYLGKQFLKDPDTAIHNLIEISECDEVGLGTSVTKHGKKIGYKMALAILSTFRDIPQVHKHGYLHFEELQLIIENFSKDRICDISCNFIKSFLIDYTIQQCEKYMIPMVSVEIDLFNIKKYKIIKEKTTLPVTPELKEPILLIPKRWLRFSPWINLEDYFLKYISTSKKYWMVKHFLELKY